jgi:hypothetical protein
MSQENAGVIILQNHSMSVHVDSASGALLAINRELADNLPASVDNATALIELAVGPQADMAKWRVMVAPGTRQRASITREDNVDASNLCITYDNLLDEETGRQLDIRLKLFLTLAADAQAVSVRAEIENYGEFFVSLLEISTGTALAVVDAAALKFHSAFGPHELPVENTVAAFAYPPGWGGGCLNAGWLDFSYLGHGLGFIYINKPNQDVSFDVEHSVDRIKVKLRTLNLHDTFPFASAARNGNMIFPVVPGETFRTGEWIVFFHDGDWHHTADFYRERFDAAFAGDFLAWEQVSPAAKQADVVITDIVAWGVLAENSNKHDLSCGIVKQPFQAIPKRLIDAAQEVGLKPENTIACVMGHMPHWGIYKMPDFFPCCAEAGGDEDAKAMVQELLVMGFAGVSF